jgi:hypothetical protein
MEKTIYKKSEDFVVRKIEEDIFIIPLKNAGEDEPLYSFPAEGVEWEIFSLIDGKRSVEEIIKLLKEKFEGDIEEIKKDTMSFLEDLEKEKIIVTVKNEL